MKKNPLIFILFLAFFRGLISSLSLPPWGLLDEEQHLDYVIKVSETGKPPIVREDFLDERIINSVLETNRHFKFHWPTPEFSYDENMTLEGYSYEGFQGPLFYYLFTPFFMMSPGNILDQLFILRIVIVLSSLITIYFAYKICNNLLKLDYKITFFILILFISIPERAFSNARISNDILLEIISIVVIYLLTLSILKGISWKLSIGLGVLGGLGLLTKIAFAGLFVAYPIVFLLNTKDKSFIIKAFLTATLIIIISSPYFLYNYNLYGDLTGYKGFETLYENFGVIWNPDLTFTTIVSSLFRAFKHFWIVWWEGSVASTNNLTRLIWLVLGFFTLVSGWNLFQLVKKENFSKDHKLKWVIFTYILIILSFLFLVILGYFQGQYPEIQGRFVNPAIFPILFLFGYGLSKSNISKNYIFFIPIMLLTIDFIFLFGNLLPYHYYFSQFFINGESIPIVWKGWTIAFTQFSNNFVGDKPVWVIILFFISLSCYIFMLQLMIRKIFSEKLKENLWI